MKTFKIISVLAALLMFSKGLQAQLTIDNSLTATQLAQLLAGPNITVQNASLSGSNLASGSFDGIASNIGMDSGVILSTGLVTDAPGPNTSNGGGPQDDLGQPGTPEMTALAGVGTNDAITLQFDFEVQSDNIQFQYIFASEEYPEYAPPNNSGFNDVFAFYVSGPGITGQENIALVPGTANPVAINNINAVTNNQYYIENTDATVQYDAWTTSLTASKSGLTPCQTYTMTLVIADAGDAQWNSSVFLLENSFIQGVVDVNTQTVNADNIALEGCIPASFTFSLDVASTSNTDISYQIAGSATNGVDYQFIDNVVTIPAGQTSADIVINSISDGITEGQEEIYIIFQANLCAPQDTAILYINDAQPIEFTLDGFDLGCFDNMSGEIQVNATGGFPPYTYTVTDNSGNGTTNTYTSNPITGLASDTYSVQVYDIYGCKADALVIGGNYNAGTTFLPDGNGVSYTSTINISGFPANATLNDMNQLQQICATMEHSYLGDLRISIISPSGQSVILKDYPGGGSCNLGEPFASAPVDGANSNLVDPGIGYEYCWNASPNYGTMIAESNNYTYTVPSSTGGTYDDNYLPAGAYTSQNPLNGLLGSDLNGNWVIEVTDNLGLDNGYIFDWNVSLVSDLPDTLIELTEPNPIVIAGLVTQAQCGGNDGSIDINISGDFPPYSFLWSNGAVSEDISGIPSGIYTVLVTDNNGCSDSATYNLNNISSINISETITDVECFGSATGSIDLVTSGGTGPYIHSWSNGANIEDVSGLSSGDYTVTITDANSCTFSQVLTVGSSNQIDIQLATSSNEICGSMNGFLEVNSTGGSGSYGYIWSNGDVSNLTSNLIAGTYSVDVTDGFGCTANNSFTLVNDVSNCSAFCYLAVTENSLTEEICGNGTGAIDINITDATQPYTVSWSTGATTEDISGLTSGNYTVTVNDANQCSVTETFSLTNNTGSLALSINSLVNEVCGNSLGEVNINVNGGNAPYSFSWSTGSTGQNISGLSEGTYDVTVTDNSGCSAQGSYTISNNTGGLFLSAGIIDESCGGGAGWINLSVNGGQSPFSYNWSNGESTQDIFNLSAGNYSLEVSDANGCIIQSDVYTVNNSAGTLQLQSTNVSNEDCGDGTGAIDLFITGGTAPLTYSWSNGDVTEDISALNAGTYSGTITDVDGCSIQTGNIVVYNSPGNLTVVTANATDEVCGDGTGAIDVDINGGTAPYVFSWSNGFSTEDIGGLSSGNYVLTVIDANGCVFNHTDQVNDASPGFNVLVNSTTDEVCGDATGSIDVNVLGGAAPFSYSWSNGSTTEDLTGINAGTYSLDVSDLNGCITSTSTSISGAGLIISNSTIFDEVCGNNQGSISYSLTGGTPPYVYSWSNGSVTQDLTNISAGNYTVVITDGAGCTATEAFTVNNNTNGFSIDNLAVIDETCGASNGAIDATLSGGIAPLVFSWSNSEFTEDISGLSSGNYTLTATDNSGCWVSSTTTITNLSGGFSATIDAATDETCGDGLGSISVSITGGAAPYTYTWSNGATTEDITGLSAGSYTLTITDANSCTISLNSVVSNVTGTLAIQSAVVQNESCNDQTGFIDITINGGTPPYSYAWSNGAITEDITGLSTGAYNCVITDASGCSINYSGVLNGSATNIQVVETIINDECSTNTGEILVTASGGAAPYTFTWDGNIIPNCCDYTLDMQDIGNSWNGASIDVVSNGVIIGNYTVFGGGANIETFQLCDGDNIDLVFNSGAFDNEISFDLLDPNGTILFSQSAPTAGNLFSFSPNCGTLGQTSSNYANLSAGQYMIEVTDAFGCTYSQTYTVGNSNNGNGLSIDNFIVTDENCGMSDGEIDAITSGGNGPLNYNWSSGQSSEDITGLNSGTFDLTVTDSDGCFTTSSTTVNNNTGGLIVSFTGTNDESCGIANGSIDITVNGGTPPYNYSWSNGSSTEDLTGIAAGNYDVTVTDGVGCSVTGNTSINNNTGSFEVLFANTQPETCGDGSGLIDLTISGGTLPYTFAWSTGEITEDIFSLSSGVYTCVITDGGGCILNYSVDLTDPTFQLSETITNETCGNMSGGIEVALTGGTQPFSYTWNGTPASTCCDYTIDMADSWGDGWNGCDVTINSNGVLVGTYTIATGSAAIETFSVCNGDNIEVIFNDGAFSNEVSFDIVDPNGVIIYTGNQPTTDGTVVFTFNPTCGSTNFTEISNLSAGTYTLEVTDGSGCTITEDYVVSNNQYSPSVVATNIQPDLCGSGSGLLDYTVTNGINPISIEAGPYSGTGVTGTLNGMTAGNYDLIAVDDNGCSDTIQVIIPNQITFTTSATSTEEDCGQSNGTIDLTVTGAGGFQYTWDNGATTEDLSGLSEGDYSVTIESLSDGCIDNQTFTIVNNVSFTTVTTSVDENCGDGNGAVDLTVSGTATNLTYSWDNGATTEDLVGLSAGTYICEVTDTDNGCTEIVTVTITNVSSGLIVSGISNDDNCEQGVGDIDITSTGGSGSYSYSWSNGASTEDINSLLSGVYTVTITDLGDNCQVSETFTINNTTNFTLSGVVTNDNCLTCGFGSIDLTVSATVSDAPYTFNWSNGSTSEDISGLTPGVYSVTVTGASGCQVDTVFTVENNNDLGLEEGEQNTFKVYPNPASDILTVEYELLEQKEVSIILINSIGQTIFVEGMNGKKESVIFDVNHLAKGVYQLVFSGSGINEVRKIVIQ